MPILAPALLSAAAAALIGYGWFSPRAFGGAWVRYTNLTPEQIERGKRRAWLSAAMGFLASMLAAFVMSAIGVSWGVQSAVGSLELAAVCWAGFCVPAMLGQVLWDQRPVRLFLINSLYWLVSFSVIALILFYTSVL